MQIQRHYTRRAARLERLMSSELGLKRGDLVLRAKRARQRLPRAVKRDLAQVAQAAHLAGNPRIARQLDQGGVQQAFVRAKRYLTGPELRAARKTRRVRLMATLALKLLVVAVGLSMALLWSAMA